MGSKISFRLCESVVSWICKESVEVLYVWLVLTENFSGPNYFVWIIIIICHDFPWYFISLLNLENSRKYGEPTDKKSYKLTNWMDWMFSSTVECISHQHINSIEFWFLINSNPQIKSFLKNGVDE